MDIICLPSGTVCPALRRLEDSGFVESKWEKHQIAQKELRPPRKYYELTKGGDGALAEALKRYRMLDASQNSALYSWLRVPSSQATCRPGEPPSSTRCRRSVMTECSKVAVHKTSPGI